VLTPSVVRDSLWLADTACLSVIGVSAGAELSARDLRGDAKKIIVWTTCIALFTWLAVFGAFTIGGVSERVQFLEDMNNEDKNDLNSSSSSSSLRYAQYWRTCAVGSLIATLSIARSPASAIAVLRETEARGPFSKLTVSVTVLKDVLVVVLFALNMEMIESLGLMNVNHVGSSSSSGSSSGSGSSTSSSDSSGSSRNQILGSASLDVMANETAYSTTRRHLMTGEETTNEYEYQMRSIIRALEPIVSVFGSFVFGFFAGAPLHSVLRRLPSPPAQTDDTPSPSMNVRLRFRVLTRQSMKPLFTIAYSTTIFVVSKQLFLLEPLLVCVCCGIFCANRGNFSTTAGANAASLSERDAAVTTTIGSSPPSPSSAATATTTTNKLAQQQLFNAIGSKSLHSSLVSLQPSVNLVFFTLAGVALEMEHVVKSAQAAILLVTFRMLGIFIACRVAIRLLSPSELTDSVSSVDIERQRNVAWMAHVTQAGVALGLARTCSVKFSDWGEQFASVATAMIALNLLIGPPLFRFALTRVGEARVTDANAVDGAQEE
jgi:hypothetical protein